MLKIVKERSKFVKYINEMLRLSLGVERMIYFALIFILLCHITTCMWFLTAKLGDLSPQTWVTKHGYQDEDNFTVILRNKEKLMGKSTYIFGFEIVWAFCPPSVNKLHF